MKKNRVLCLLLAVLMALSMAGCKGNSPGGERFREGERAVEITGVFPVQIPMGFEDFPILNIAEGVNGELLPIQVPPSTLIYFLPAMG